ncbi:MAG: TetR/AcrR family transcriptional regulator [Propionibacteriaceae bacterium]|jgi:AcrR family transcriptional regulator|nr:TetR/AcrR family transcriptional regulator [Propionibacteriaceae bacterium]
MDSPPRTSQERILSAAKQVFAAHGYRGGSLNDVATLAGYTRAGLLHHYPSKQAVLLALLDLRDERLGTRDWREVESIFTVIERLPDLVRRILEDRVLVQLAHALTAEASESGHPAHEWAAGRQDQLRQRLVASVRHSIDARELAPSIDPESLAAVILAAVEGLEAQWLINESVSPVQGARTLRQLLEGIRLR